MRSLWQKMFVVSSLGVFVVGGLYVQPVQAASACKNITLTAHRGYVDRRHTENTYRAFTAAANKGADAIEFDIRVTADHQWMIMHDNTVNRTTNGNGRVAIKTAGDVRKLHVKDSAVTGVVHRVPYLESVVKLHKTYPNLRFQIEFKSQPISDAELTEGLAIIMTNVPTAQLMITSSDMNILTRIRALNTDVVLGYILPNGVKPNLSVAKKAGVNYINAHFRDVTKAKVVAAHKMGIKISLRSANSAADWRKVISKGADNLVTDNIVGYNKWCK